MEQLSKFFPIFVASFRKEWQHRGELLSFDPPVNLENSCEWGKSFVSDRNQ